MVCDVWKLAVHVMIKVEPQIQQKLEGPSVLAE